MVARIRNIFLSLNGKADPAPLLETALATAQRFHAGITAVLMEGQAASTIPLGGGGMGAGAVQGLRTDSSQEQATRFTQIRALLKTYATSGRVIWSEGTDSPLYPPASSPSLVPTLQLHFSRATLEDTLTRYAQLTDLAVLPHPLLEPDPLTNELRNELLRQKCVPLLLAPTTARPNSLKNVALAWAPTPDAIRTLKASLPWLRAAHNIQLLHEADSAPSAQLAADYLRLHDLSPKLYAYQPEDLSASQTLLKKLFLLDTDLLITDLQPPGRLRNLLLGPSADSISERAPFPILACG